MIKNNRGFSLVELIIAAAISMGVMFGIGTVLIDFLSFSKSVEGSSDGQEELILALKKIRRNIRNTIRLDDAEKSAALAGYSFMGLEILPAGLIPSQCRNDMVDSAFRNTSLTGKRTPSLVIKAWSESTGLNASVELNQLIISYNPSDSNGLVTADYKPKEVVLIDNDLFQVRRYRVIDTAIVENTDISPFTGAKSFDSSGNLIYYTYARLKLVQPKNVDGSAVTLTPTTFVANTAVQDSETKTTCLEKVTNRLINIFESEDKTEAVYNGGANSLNIKTFKVAMGFTPKNNLTQIMQFFNQSSVDISCVNSVQLTFEFQHSTTQKLQSMNVVQKETFLTKQNDFYLPNLNFRRPIRCLN